jgi:pectinesterase
VKFRGIALILVGQLALAATAPTPPPFTLESALKGIAKSHPQARRVTDALPPGVAAKENLPYAQPDGITLDLDLYRPEGNRVCPAVIIVHGGGWVAGDRTMERSLARHLAARGYVAATVSYRLGETGRFPNAILDLRTAVRWLRAHAGEFHLQPDRIGAIGGSAGGMLVTFLGATNGEPAYDPGTPEEGGAVQAVVNIDGLATFLDHALILQSEGPPSPYYVFQHGTYRTARATWVEASPLHHVGPRSAPTLFIKSTTARPILPGRDEMAARLKIFGIDSEVVQFPDTPHVFWLFHPWFERVVEETDQFLRRHLGS